jgi:hypothetical protein
MQDVIIEPALFPVSPTSVIVHPLIHLFNQWQGNGFLNRSWIGQFAVPARLGTVGTSDQQLSGDRRYFEAHCLINFIFVSNIW